MPKLTANQKITFKQNVNDIIEAKPFDKLISTLGPKGKLEETFSLQKEYNEIEMDIPKGLDENMVTAIIIGAMMDSKVNGIDDWQLTASSPDVRKPIDSNQNYVIDNVAISDKRGKFFDPIIVEARKKAKAALEAFKNNDPEPAKAFLQNYIDFEARNMVNVKFVNTKAFLYGNYNSRHDNYIEGVSLATTVMGKPPFNVMPENVTPIQTARLQSYGEQVKAFDQAALQRHSLVNDLNMLSNNIKAERAADFLFNLYVSNISACMDDRENKMKNRIFYGYIKQLGGPDGLGDDPEENMAAGSILSDDKNIAYAYEDLNQIIKENTIGNIDAILASPGGYDKLKRLYISSIKKSPEYAAIVNAATEADMIDAISDAESACAVNLTDKFKSVKLPDMASPLNKAQREKLDQDVQKIRNTVEKGIGDIIKRRNAANALYMNGIETDNMQNNAVCINELVENIKGVNKRGGSQNFKDMYEALKEFRDYAKKLADSKRSPSAAELQKYIDLGEKVGNLASHYLDHKTKINSTYAENRVRAVNRLIKNLAVNLASARGLKEECLKKDLGADYKAYKESTKYSPLVDEATVQSFRSKQYTTYRSMPKSGASYSMNRMAVYSVSLMALAVTGDYSIDDLMDPSKFRDEKSLMFDKVVEKMTYVTPENQKWIAEMMVKGMEKTRVMVDEKMKTLDFTDPKIFESDTMKKITALSMYRFDIWQEVEHCKNEAEEFIKELHPEIPNYRAYSEKIRNDVGMLGTIRADEDKRDKYIRMFMEEAFPEDSTKAANLIGEILNNAIESELMRRSVADKMKNGNDVEYSKVDDRMEGILLNSASLTFKTEMGDKLTRIYEKHPELLREHLASMMNGEYFKDVKVKIDLTSPNPVEITGMNELLEKVKTDSFMKEAEEATVRLETQKYKNREDFFRDSALAITGGVYKVSGKLPKKTETGKVTSLQDYAEAQFNSPTFRNSLLSTKEPKKMKNPKSIAETARNPEKIRKIIKAANKKELAKLQANGPEVLKDNPQARPRNRRVEGAGMGKKK